MGSGNWAEGCQRKKKAVFLTEFPSSPFCVGKSLYVYKMASQSIGGRGRHKQTMPSKWTCSAPEWGAGAKEMGNKRGERKIKSVF